MPDPSYNAITLCIIYSLHNVKFPIAAWYVNICQMCLHWPPKVNHSTRYGINRKYKFRQWKHSQGSNTTWWYFPDLEPLEDLDDAEFGLPPIEQPPSLEDILAADENDELDEFLEDEVCLDSSSHGHALLNQSINYPTNYDWDLSQH